MAIIELEKELEDYLYETAKEHFYESPLSEFISGRKIFRQVNINGYGIIDLIVVNFDIPTAVNSYPNVEITIIELKKDEINHQALEQISRYRTAIKRFIETIIKKSKPLSYTIEGVLIGSNINEQSDLVYLVDNIQWLSLLTYSIDLDSGLTLKDVQGGWFPIKEDFDSLEKKLPKLMPDFLDTYKSWHKYNLKNKRKNIAIEKIK